ncbi:glycosyltransferase [Nostocoides australiense]|uniref:glycosyltransferase n=1 Tax=Nostocoides australiense TaxID=99480 RepID=UPI00138ED740|nr:glycosyltransferase [Tetrasphaera australiensis]
MPIHDVEAELPRCVDSILAQTYADLQVILVDDGSPDGSGGLCDAYAAADPRVEVIHQDNAGLSGARNAGLDRVRGFYVTFVDGDDWLDHSFVETLVGLAEQQDTQIAVCRFARITSDPAGGTHSGPPEVRCLTGDQALTEHFGDLHTLWTITPAKLYRTSLWEGMQFPDGRIHEDEFTTFRVLHRASRVTVTSAVLYNYLQRPGSLTGGPATVISRRHSADAAAAQLDYVRGCRPDLVGPAAGRLVRKQLALHRALVAAADPNAEGVLHELRATADLLKRHPSHAAVAVAAQAYARFPAPVATAMKAYAAAQPRARARAIRSRKTRQRRLRVLVSSGWLGGAGGAERALHSVLAALADDDVDVVVRRRLDGPLAVVPDRVRVHDYADWRWWAAGYDIGAKGWLIQRVLNPVRSRLLGRRYDVLLRSLSGPALESAARSRVSLIVPSGERLTPDVAGRYSFVAMQAPDNIHLAAGARTVLLPPPLLPLPTARRPRQALPSAYLLTVFNPYGAVKGLDDLLTVVDAAPLPIVWCHSQRTLDFDLPGSLVGHANLLHVDDPEPGELRHLYENCAAYVSFSRSEGFGWSIADALRYAPAVVARNIGVLTYEESRECPVKIVDGFDEVDWAWIGAQARPDSPRELSWLSPGAFRRRLADLTGAAP